MSAPKYSTAKPWRRYVREVSKLEDAAAGGNTWGPDHDAAILASLMVIGIAEKVNKIDPPESEDNPEIHTAYFEGWEAAIAAVTELLS